MLSAYFFYLACLVLIHSMLGNNFADNILKYFFVFFPENRLWPFMQIVSTGDNLHEMSNPIFCGYDLSCKLSPGDNFAWNAKPYFLWKMKTYFQNAVCWKFNPASLALKNSLLGLVIYDCLHIYLQNYMININNVKMIWFRNKYLCLPPGTRTVP